MRPYLILKFHDRCCLNELRAKTVKLWIIWAAISSLFGTLSFYFHSGDLSLKHNGPYAVHCERYQVTSPVAILPSVSVLGFMDFMIFPTRQGESSRKGIWRKYLLVVVMMQFLNTPRLGIKMNLIILWICYRYLISLVKLDA